MSDNPTGLEYENIETANEQIANLRQDVAFFRHKWAEMTQEELNRRAELREAHIAHLEAVAEINSLKDKVDACNDRRESEQKATDSRVIVALAMFKELDRRHDFTHAEIRGAIKLIEGYVGLIARVSAMDDIPF